MRCAGRPDCTDGGLESGRKNESSAPNVLGRYLYFIGQSGGLAGNESALRFLAQAHSKTVRSGCSLSAIILMRRACSRLWTHFSARRIGIAKRRRNSPRAFSVACTASLRARRIAHTVFALAPCAISLKNALDVWPYLTGLWRMYCHAHL